MSNKKIQIQSLILEVTRRCNMKCPHCLRGEAENMDMSEEVVDNLLEYVEEIQNITFSGGEPFMNYPIMQYVLDKVKEKGIPVYSIFVATNGKEVKDEYLKLMDDWVLYTLSCNYATEEWLDETAYMPENMQEDICSAVAVSRDIYHETIPTENYLKWRLRSYYSTVKEKGPEHYPLINEGQARENGLGKRNISVGDFYVEEDDGSLNVDELYVSANGDIVPDCDFSYETIEESGMGNILRDSLYDILKPED